MKFALVSNPLPPSSSGQAMMIYQLLKDVDPRHYCLISPQSPDTNQASPSANTLPGRRYQLSTTFEMKRGYRFGLGLVREMVNITLGTLMRARQIARIVRREKCQAVVSCSSGSDLLDMPAGYLASRLAAVPFYAYLFDTYSHMWLPTQTPRIGQLLEPYLLKRAAGVVATNELLQELLASRYGIESVVIHNPCDLSQYQSGPDEFRENNEGEISIVYTGAIYEAHYDTFRNLIAAIESLRKPGLKLHLYTSFLPEALAAQGICGPVVYHDHLPFSAMPQVQKSADMLFLPLAFHSPYPELIKVSSPSKVGEFLATRRPILVHAPAGSFLSSYFRREGCGLVVDEEDPAKLADAIELILSDRDLQQRLSARAWERAQADFDLPSAQARFSELLGLN
jgi:glycosyltransferase involved in cell wall biosynthesis